MKDHDLEKRRYIIAGITTMVVVIYIVRLFTLQLLSDDYKKNADGNVSLKEIDYPSRGIITDHHSRLMVYNQPAYDIMVAMNEQKNRTDTLELCETLGITKGFFKTRMTEIKGRNRNPGCSRFTQQPFMSRLSDKEFSVFQKKTYRLPGFYVQKRSIRQYQYPYVAYMLGDVAKVSPSDIEGDDYHQAGDHIGKLSVERSYEKQLRGQEGVQILSCDAHGKVQGSYQNDELDAKPIPDKNLIPSLDLNLQALGERLLQGRIRSIAVIEPSTDKVLCTVSSPTYDPRWMVGKKRGRVHHALQRNRWKPLLSRSIMGQYPPGSTFKTAQALTYLSEGIIPPSAPFAYHRRLCYRGLHVDCHDHALSLALASAVSMSCNAYFCWGLYYMVGNRHKYKNVQTAMDTWCDYMVNTGFSYKLGIDLPSEGRGLTPSSAFYDRAYHGLWNGLTITSISVGQGEVNLTPSQVANPGAAIANRGYYHMPRMVWEVQSEPLDILFTCRHYTKASRRAYDHAVTETRSAIERGTHRAANRVDCTVCGKAGTAQNREYDRPVFIGFVPMNSPGVAIAVCAENGGFGVDFSMPIGSLMMEQYIRGSLSPASKTKVKTIRNRRIGCGSSNR